jgi:hypothetical protein
MMAKIKRYRLFWIRIVGMIVLTAFLAFPHVCNGDGGPQGPPSPAPNPSACHTLLDPLGIGFVCDLL